MRPETASPDPKGRDDLEIRPLGPGDGPALVACIRRCYGETHVDPGLYAHTTIEADLSSGRRHSVGAFTSDGRVVGHLGLVLRRPGDTTADAGLTMVDPEWRGRGLAHRLAAELGRQARALGLVGLHDYPVTVHAGTQRLARGHALTVGLLIDNLPGDVSFEAMKIDADPERRSTPSLVRYMAIGRAPARSVHLPACHASLAANLYAHGGLERTITPGEATSGSAPLVLESSPGSRRGVVRHTIVSPGPSDAALVRALSDPSAPGETTQVDVLLADPRAPRAIRALRAEGFFFGALLPEFRGGDVLRLQRPARVESALDGIVLEEEAMRSMAEAVLADARAVRSDPEGRSRAEGLRG